MYKKKKERSHLSKSERKEIALFKKKKYSLRDIAKMLGRAVSTISEEIARRKKKNGVYDPNYAHHRAYTKRKYAKYQGMKVVGDATLNAFVDRALKEGRSPESIAGRLKCQEKAIQYVSKEGIKTYLKSVYGRKIEALRKRLFPQRNRRKRSRTKGTLDGRTFIEKRPRCATERRRVGDAEADFILSGKDGRGILLTVADRKTRASFIERILVPTIRNMEKAFLRIKKRFPEMRTITTDNDLLFQHHRRLEKLLEVKIYFCHPYHSWEKGTIERTNKEIRRYIPKGSDISFYPPSFVKKVEERINDRWMKVLQYSSPKESLEQQRKRKKKR